MRNKKLDLIFNIFILLFVFIFTFSFNLYDKNEKNKFYEKIIDKERCEKNKENFDKKFKNLFINSLKEKMKINFYIDENIFSILTDEDYEIVGVYTNIYVLSEDKKQIILFTNVYLFIKSKRSYVPFFVDNIKTSHLSIEKNKKIYNNLK